MRHVEYARAHEAFAEALAASGLVHTVVRPTGFFWFFGEILEMARAGRGVVIGPGDARTILSLRDAIRGELSFTSPEGKRYEVTAAETPTIVMRPRGWHLVEQHIRFTDRGGRTMAASPE